MNKKVQGLTDDEKQYNAQLLLEKELTRLQREYFVSDKEQSQSQFTKGSKLLKSLRVIELFQREHQEILTNLSVATTLEKKRDAEKLNDELSALLDEYDDFDSRIVRDQTYLKEIEGNKKMVAKNVIQLRKSQITDRQCEERVWAAMKTVEALENKLEVQVKKFCSICTKNRALREEMEHLLCERRTFLVIWDKLIDKLAEGKKIMLDLIEQATLAYNQREEWCTKLQILRLRAHHGLNANIQEMREHKRKHDHNWKLKQFFLIKGQKLNLKTLQEKEKAKRLKLQEVLKTKMENYQHMMADILEFTQERDVRKIMVKFTQQEELNLSFFTYVNDMIGEMESVNDHLGGLYLEIDHRYLLHETRGYEQRSKLEDLQHHLDQVTQNTQNAEEKLATAQGTINNLLQGIGKLFAICKCDNDPLLQLLGDHTTVQSYNVFLYLHLLETKIHECLITACYGDKISHEKKTTDRKVLAPEDTTPIIYSIEKIILSTPCSLCVEHEMVNDVVDVTQCVLSKREAQKKLQRQLQTPDGLARLHKLSACHLPRAREVIQRRYE